jgi:hypothetical protein
MINNKYEERRVAILERIDIADYMWKFHHGLFGREAAQATARIASNRFQIRWPKGMSNVGAHNMTDASQSIKSAKRNTPKPVVMPIICSKCA